MLVYAYSCVVDAINAAVVNGRSVFPCASRFDAFWPTLEKDLEAARSIKGSTTTVTSVREPAEILEEVLVLARRQESVLRTIVERVDSSVPMLAFRRGVTSSSDAPEGRREIVDELISHLGVPEDRALTYRIITDCVPEEIQVVYDAGAISTENVDHVLTRIGEFVASKRVHVTIKSTDGYEIIAGPGKKATVLLSPTEVVSELSDPESIDIPPPQGV
jgi:hypothetical protein